MCSTPTMATMAYRQRFIVACSLLKYNQAQNNVSINLNILSRLFSFLSYSIPLHFAFHFIFHLTLSTIFLPYFYNYNSKAKNTHKQNEMNERLNNFFSIYFFPCHSFTLRRISRYTWQILPCFCSKDAADFCNKNVTGI